MPCKVILAVRKDLSPSIGRTKGDLEQFCEEGPVFTYNSPDKYTGGVTYGGYSESIVVDEAFVLRIPKNLDLAGTSTPGS